MTRGVADLQALWWYVARYHGARCNERVAADVAIRTYDGVDRYMRKRPDLCAPSDADTFTKG